MERDKMNANLYCLLPPDKKQEYKKMFPKPVYLKIYRADKEGYMWIDQELLEIPESWTSGISAYSYGHCIPHKTDGYITKIQTDPLGSIAFLPECSGYVGAGTAFCDYGNVHEEKKLINIRNKNISITRNLLF